MILKANEAAGGLKHAGLGWQRVLLRRPSESLLPRLLPSLKNLGLPAGSVLDASGKPRTCAICGYALVRIQLEDGWTMDICSAMPVLRFNHPLLSRWLKDLPTEKMAERTAKQYTSVAQSEARAAKEQGVPALPAAMRSEAESRAQPSEEVYARSMATEEQCGVHKTDTLKPK